MRKVFAVMKKILAIAVILVSTFFFIVAGEVVEDWKYTGLVSLASLVVVYFIPFALFVMGFLWLIKGFSIKDYWRGRTGLGKSFWVVFIIGNVINLYLVKQVVWEITFFGAQVNLHQMMTNLEISTKAILYDSFRLWILMFAAVFILSAAYYFWSFIGVFRSAINHRVKGRINLFSSFALLTSVLVTAGIAYLIVQLSIFYFGELNNATELITYQPGPDFFKIEVSGELISFKGEIVPGVSDEFQNRLNDNPGITTVHLESIGGVVGEGLRIAKLVKKSGVNTFVTTYCASACTVVFLGGSKRVISPKARLGFHRSGYSTEHDLRIFRGLDWYGDELGKRAQSSSFQELRIKLNNLKDEYIYSFQISRGVKSWFIDKARIIPFEDIWYPTHRELLSSGYVTSITSRID